MLTGGCHCGGIRYEIRGAPREPSLCHCVDCRRTCGAPAVAWFTVAPEEFAVVAGRPASYASSTGVTRQFCPGCGTQLTFRRADLADEIDVTTCSLDDPARVPPQRYSFTDSRVPWMAVDEELAPKG